MFPTLLAPAALLMAVLMLPHYGGARLAAQSQPVARRAVDRQVADPALLAAVTTLLDIDRAFSKTSSDLSMRAALDAMFADGVIAPWQRGEIVKGKAAVIRALLQSPDSVAKLSWAPIRGGVSADGLHGFTFGYLAAEYPDGRLAHSKYMAYWVREPRGWRVAAWKRRPIGAAPLASEPQPPSLPPRRLKVTTNSDVIARYYRSLVNAEAGFASLAQRVGLWRAFAPKPVPPDFSPWHCHPRFERHLPGGRASTLGKPPVPRVQTGQQYAFAWIQIVDSPSRLFPSIEGLTSLGDRAAPDRVAPNGDCRQARGCEAPIARRHAGRPGPAQA